MCKTFINQNGLKCCARATAGNVNFLQNKIWCQKIKKKSPGIKSIL